MHLLIFVSVGKMTPALKYFGANEVTASDGLTPQHPLLTDRGLHEESPASFCVTSTLAGDNAVCGGVYLLSI